jgi:hypothetical protein
VRIAASLEIEGSAKAPTWVKIWPKVLAGVAESPQPELLERTVEAELKSVRTGSGRTPVTPKDARTGPSPRTRTLFEPVPPTTNPAIKVCEPVPAVERTERFTRCALPVEPPITTVAAVTVSVPKPLVLEPAGFSSSTWNMSPLDVTGGSTRVRVAVVAPEKAAPLLTLAQVAPEFADDCHW